MATVLIGSGENSMKAQCMKAMKLAYPHGVGTAQQHRDIIRVYFIGWGDCLKAQGDTIALEEFVKVFGYIADLNWWPDNSWCWWT